MTIDEFNALPTAQVHALLADVCRCERWVAPVLAGRPYASGTTLLTVADAVWSQMLEPDLLEAFADHPEVGDPAALEARRNAGDAIAAEAQAMLAEADPGTLARLAAGSRDYAKKFGFRYIVCSAGMDAPSVCEDMESRLANNREAELALAAEEQRRILRRRLEAVL